MIGILLATIFLLMPFTAFAQTGSAVYYAAYMTPPVICDDSTDTTVALQNAVMVAENSSLTSTGSILQLPYGFCHISSNITINKAITIRGAGAGMGIGTGNSGGTDIRSSCAACDHFTVTDDDQAVFQDMTLDKEVVATGGSGIDINPASGINRRSRIENVTILGTSDGVYMINTANFSIDKAYIQDFTGEGIYVAATATNPDLGDASITNSTIWDFNVTSGDADIRLDPAGGMEISGNKLLGGNFGLRLTVSQGPTGTLNFTGNSVEQHNVTEIYMQQTTPGKTYSFVNIDNNEFQTYSISGYQNAITAAANSTQYLSDVTINSNVFKICNSLYGIVNLQSVNGVVVTGNVFDRCGNSSITPVVLGTNALNALQANNVVH